MGLSSREKNVTVDSKIIATIHVVMRPLVACLLMLPVRLENVVISKLVNPRLQVLCADCLSMNVIYLNIVQEPRSSVLRTSTRLTGFLARLDSPTVIRVLVEHIQINVAYSGDHLERNLTISVMNKTGKEAVMETVDTI
jgi:hypothetical protein